MHTIKLQVNDTIYDDIIKSGVNIQEELKLALHKLIYKKEHNIANDINQSLQDIKDAKSRPISELLSEI
jgi:hypothetical protein